MRCMVNATQYKVAIVNITLFAHTSFHHQPCPSHSNRRIYIYIYDGSPETVELSKVCELNRRSIFWYTLLLCVAMQMHNTMEVVILCVSCLPGRRNFWEICYMYVYIHDLRDQRYYIVNKIFTNSK